jgi:PAS domain S-box-containing protein
MENARLITETREALEQQTATAEVLGIINSSPGDLEPVFDALLEKAMHLCSADFGILRIFDGDLFHGVASRGVPPVYAEFLAGNPQRPQPGTMGHRIIDGEPLVHVIDVVDDQAYGSGVTDPHRRALFELGGARTSLIVPLRKDQTLLGAVQLYRQHVQAFTERQIALLQNFAAQAVIAMENARLITETREALEQQTATAEVLEVINSSRGDLTPVFDAMLEKAHELCGIASGSLELYDGESFRAVAVRGLSDTFADLLRQGYPASDNPATRPLIEGHRLAHIHDVAETNYSITRSSSELEDVHTLLCVPLRRSGTLIGMIASGRREIRPFSDKEISLLENFAAQAVIAIENARLITETREALDQQTATAEVLSVINSSPGDLAPVFETMLEKAMRLCEAAFGLMHIYDGERVRPVARRGLPPRFAEFVANPANQPGPGGATPRLIGGARYVHIADLKDEEAYRTGEPYRRALVEVGGARTLLAVPLIKDGTFLGQIAIYRQEVRPYSDKQITLLENFAAQAVIAMENARLITETREALEQQTATAEVLGVINSSPGDLAPVFDTVLEKAMRLCEADLSVFFTYDGDVCRASAMRGATEEYARFLTTSALRPSQTNIAGMLIRGEPFVELADIAVAGGYRAGDPAARAAVDLGGMRSVLAVPLRQDNRLLGIVIVYRREVRRFTDNQIALVQNFAAQAVIAMENARLLTETREALEQQTATAEVLGVINSSPSDLVPVFETMLEKATHLCGADFGILWVRDGEEFRAAAARGVPEAYMEVARHPLRPLPENPLGQMLRGERLFISADLAAEEIYQMGDPTRRAVVDLGGARSAVQVALVKDDVLLGSLTAFRQEVRPFTDKQVALLQNFAAQAVIAMENARLLDEIRQRQAELRVTFDNMADGVAMFDATLRLTAWNRNLQELLALPEDFLAERHSLDEYIRYLAERGEYGNTEAETQIDRLHSRLSDHYSFERTRPDGTVIEVRNNQMPDGGVVLIYSDITERKRSEEEIRAARDAAEASYHDLQAAQANLVQAQKMAALGQLTAGIAHEIKNPLNFVNNFASLSTELLDELKEEVAPALATLDGDKRDGIDETIEMLTGNLEKIVEHGQRADHIVKSMLEHSRGVSGERREVDLNGLVEEALNLAYHGARAHDQGFNITLERNYAQDLKPIEVAPQEMTRVFLNLLGNGFYAANKRAQDHDGGSFRPTLAVSTCEHEDTVEVRVRDNGTGISAEIRDKLFQPFFTTKPTGEGTGLGLSISYDIVTQQHGGTITVESEPGAFTEFTVRLPRH